MRCEHELRTDMRRRNERVGRKVAKGFGAHESDALNADGKVEARRQENGDAHMSMHAHVYVNACAHVNASAIGHRRDTIVGMRRGCRHTHPHARTHPLVLSLHTHPRCNTTVAQSITDTPSLHTVTTTDGTLPLQMWPPPCTVVLKHRHEQEPHLSSFANCRPRPSLRLLPPLSRPHQP
jgi:hypothetical protein